MPRPKKEPVVLTQPETTEVEVDPPLRRSTRVKAESVPLAPASASASTPTAKRIKAEPVPSGSAPVKADLTPPDSPCANAEADPTEIPLVKAEPDLIATAAATTSIARHKHAYNLGYACLNMTLRKDGIFTSRTARLASIVKGADLHALADQNLKDLMTILAWNAEHDIRLFRMSSGLFPFATHPVHGYSLEPFAKQLEAIGDFAKSHDMRLTFHPSQFVQLSSINPKVTANSVIEITHHADTLDMMGLGKDSICVLHLGGTAGGKPAAIQRFGEVYDALPKRVADRIVLENCETYAVHDILPFCLDKQIPMVFDYHHHAINGSDLGPIDFKLILKTWADRGIKPKFHISESRVKNGSYNDRRAHSDYILNSEAILENHPPGVDLMVEAKCKELAVAYILENQLATPPPLDTKPPKPRVKRRKLK